MRHGKKINHLSRTASHRRHMLSNMASSLLLNKRVTTTVAKAKALRKYIEPIISKGKNDSSHSRRVVFAKLQNKDAIKELFDRISEKVFNRPGGYTRIIRLGARRGDNAEMCIIELVDYNDNLIKEGGDTSSKGKTRRRKRGGKSTKASEEGSTDTKSENAASTSSDVLELDNEKTVETNAKESGGSTEENVEAKEEIVEEETQEEVEISTDKKAEDSNSEEDKKE